MNTKTKITALVTTILLLVGFAGPAQAAPERLEPASVTQSVEIPVSAPPVSLTFDRVSVKTTHVPIYVAPVPVATAPVVPQSGPTAPVRTQQAQTAPTTQKAPAKPSTAPTAPAAPVQSQGSGSGAALLGAARSQIGQRQDCTAMVERALASIGIITGDIGPSAFSQYGTAVATPAPGDIIISSGHVGIYAGNGMMVSGGFNGGNTVEHPIKYVGGYTAYRVA